MFTVKLEAICLFRGWMGWGAKLKGGVCVADLKDKCLPVAWGCDGSCFDVVSQHKYSRPLHPRAKLLSLKDWLKDRMVE